MYYVITKGGGGQPNTYICLEGGGGAKGSCLRNHSLEEMLNNLHNFFQGIRKLLGSYYQMCNFGI